MAIAQSLLLNLKTDTGSLSPKLTAAERRLKEFDSKVKAMGNASALTGFAARVAAPVLAIGSVIKAATWGIELAAQAETAQKSFETMLGSATRAKQLMGDLEQFGAKTPFELPGLVESARMLMAFGEDVDDVLPRLKTLGDIASGSGAKVEDLAEIWGKIKVKGKLSAEEANRLLERGVGLYKVLATQMGVPETQIAKLMEQGKISANEVKKAFESMAGSGGIYENAMEKQSETLAGIWSNLVDNVKGILKELGVTLIEVFNFKSLLKSVVDVTGWIKKAIIDWREWFVNVWKGIGYVIASLGTYWQIASDNVQLFCLSTAESIAHVFTDILPALFQNFGKQLTQAFVSITDNVSQIMAELWDYIGSGGTDAIELKLKPILIEEVAQALERKITPAEKKLQDRIKANRDYLNDSWKELFKDEKKLEEKGKPKGLKSDLATEESKDKSKDKVEVSAISKGTTAAQTAINQYRQGITAQQQIESKKIKLQEEANKQLAKIESNTKEKLTVARV